MAYDLTFPGIARDVLADLHTRFGLDEWVLTRVAGDNSMIIFAEGDLGLEEGMIIAWANSLEARLADGGPWAAAELDDSPYAGADVPVQGIHGFAGAPLLTVDGDLFGAVYGIGIKPATFTVDQVARPLAMAVRTLALVLALEELSAPTPAPTDYDVARHDPRRDAVSGVFNARGWEEALVVETARCQRYGNSGTIVQVWLEGLSGVDGQVEGPPDEVVLRQAGDALRAWSRGGDIIARTADQLFTILLVEVDELGSQRAVGRLHQTLISRHLVARLGLADNQSRSLAHAVEVARDRALAAIPGEVPPTGL